MLIESLKTQTLQSWVLEGPHGPSPNTILTGSLLSLATPRSVHWRPKSTCCFGHFLQKNRSCLVWNSNNKNQNPNMSSRVPSGNHKVAETYYRNYGCIAIAGRVPSAKRPDTVPKTPLCFLHCFRPIIHTATNTCCHRSDFSDLL